MDQYRGTSVGRMGARGDQEAPGRAFVQRRRVPDDLVVAEKPEIVFGKTVPDGANPAFLESAAAQLGQRGMFALLQQFPGPARVLYVHSQRPLGLTVEVFEGAGLPGRPQARIGSPHVGHRQQIEMIQVDLVAHQAGEIANDRRVVDVLFLGRHRQVQVVPHQPRRQGRLARTQPVVRAEMFRVAGAQFRVVAAAALGDIVKQPRDIEHGGVFDSFHDLPEPRIRLPPFGQAETADIADHAQDVHIDRVAVKEVVLHPPRDQPELGNVGAQYPVAVHRLKLAGRVGGGGQDLHESAAILRVVPELAVDPGRGFHQPLDQGGAEAADFGVLLPQQERFQHCPRRNLQQLGPLRVQVAVARQEPGVDAPLRGPGAADDVAKPLENDFIEQ